MLLYIYIYLIHFVPLCSWILPLRFLFLNFHLYHLQTSKHFSFSLFFSLNSFLASLQFLFSPFAHTILSLSARQPFPSSHLFYSSVLPMLTVRLSLSSSLPRRLHISLSFPTSLLLVTFPSSCSPSIYLYSLLRLCTFLLLPPHVTLSLSLPSSLPLRPPSFPSLPNSFTNT